MSRQLPLLDLLLFEWHTCGGKRGGPRPHYYVLCRFAVQLGHGLGSCCVLSLGSGLAARRRPDLLLCLPLPAMALQVAIVVLLQLVLGCPVRKG